MLVLVGSMMKVPPVREFGGHAVEFQRDRVRRGTSSLEKKRCGASAAPPNCAKAAVMLEDCATRRREHNKYWRSHGGDWINSGILANAHPGLSAGAIVRLNRDPDLGGDARTAGAVSRS
jgi:hypothetical protein